MYPILARYVPAMADFLRGDGAAKRLQVAYEDLVTEPEAQLRKICQFLEIPFDPGIVHYGRKNRDMESRGLGDPLGVKKHERPVTDSVHKWVADPANDPDKAKRLLELLDDIED